MYYDRSIALLEWLARFAKARMPLVGLLALMVLLAGAPSALAAPSVQGGSNGSGPNYTHRMVEKVQVSDALCGQFKAALPAQASNPDLCFFTHGAQWTDMEPLPANVTAPQAHTGKAAPGMAMAL